MSEPSRKWLVVLKVGRNRKEVSKTVRFPLTGYEDGKRIAEKLGSMGMELTGLYQLDGELVKIQAIGLGSRYMDCIVDDPTVKRAEKAGELSDVTFEAYL